MRIPPSVIVMSLLTAVPFGLAFKDAAKSKDKIASYDDDDDEYSPRRAHDDFDGDADYAAQRAELEKMRAEERENELKLGAKRRALAAQLVGTEPASMGSLFQGVKLGASAGNFQPDPVREAISEASEVLNVHWDVDATELNGVTATLRGDEDGCSGIASAVRGWGPKAGAGWENAATHQRATFDELECSIHFERFTDLEHWLDTSATSVIPVAMIGQPAAKLRAKVGGHIDEDNEDSITWHDVGLAGGKGATALSASIENGKVVSISVELSDSVDLLPVIERVSKLTGAKPKHDEDAQTTTWKGKLAVRLYESVPSLVIGKTL
jgi:hypothetical protein